MVCLVDLQNGEIDDFLFGDGVHDLRRNIQSYLNGNFTNYNTTKRLELAIQELYRMEFPQIGKHKLQSGFYLLVG